MATTDGSAIMSVTASVKMDAGQPVTVKGDLACSGILEHYGKVIGIVSYNCQRGGECTALLFGVMTNQDWNWTPGVPIFLNGSRLSHVAPTTGFSQRLGIAKTSNQMLVDPHIPVRL